jgi:D-threo-aldose 1-dehydrogenase
MAVDGTEQTLATDGILAGLSALRSDGVIEEVSLGLNAFDPAIVQGHRRLFERPPPGTVQSVLLAGGFNLLNQNALPLLEEAEARGIEVHMAGVFSSGLLAGGSTVYAAGADNGQAPSDELLERVEGWRRLAAEHGVALPTVALAFAALPRCVKRVVVGMSSPADVRENVAMLRATASIAPAIWRQAKDRGLLDRCMPIL